MGIYSRTRDYIRNLIFLKKNQKSYKYNSKSRVDNKKSIVFNYNDSPLVTIIIPFYNQHQFTHYCLKSIEENIPRASIEIILVDDNSSESYDFSYIQGVTIIKNEKNIGFLKSVNKGISHAQGKYIYLLNNDTIVHKGFLDELIYVFDNFENVGAVGSMLLNEDGTLQEAGGFILHDKTPSQLANKKIYSPEINYIYRTDYCSGCSLLFKRIENDTLNEFDQRFAPAYFEDTDLCFQLRYLQGKEIYYTPFSKVTHFNGISYNSSKKNNIEAKKNKLFDRNFQLFKEKWLTELTEIRAVNKWERIEELYSDRHIVFFHYRIPQPDNNSGELRLTEIIKTYKKLGYQVTLIVSKNTIKNSHNQIFQRMGVRVFYTYKIFSSLLFFIQHIKTTDQLMWFSTSDVFIKYFKFANRFFIKSTLVYDMVDVHHLRYRRALETEPNNRKYKRKYKKYYKYEKKASRSADITIAISEDEKKYMMHFVPESKVIVVSNIHYPKVLPSEIPSFKQRKDLLFIGSTHHPNIDAVNFLYNEILPIVWKTHPDIKLNIVGDIYKVFKNKLNPNIKFLGHVPDITDLFLSHRMMVAPLRYGAGVKGKIGQAFEYYLPVVTSSIGAEGMFLINEKNALLADDAEDFAQQIVKLYSDEKLWLQIQGNINDSLSPFSIEGLIKKVYKIEEVKNLKAHG